MVDSVGMIRFFAEFILSVEPISFVSLRMTSEGLRMTTVTNTPIATQSRWGGEVLLGSQKWVGNASAFGPPVAAKVGPTPQALKQDSLPA